MEVGARVFVHALLLEPSGPLLHLVAILAFQGEEVELESDALRLECLVFAFLHIEIAFGVRQDGGISLVPDSLQESPEVHRSREDAGFHQQTVALVAYGQQVVAAEALFEERIEHVF